MPKDRITEIRIEGLRTLERVRLQLPGLTVLLGENGAGKSSIIEACEILRRAPEPGFFQTFHTVHGGLPSLLRQGCTQLKLGVRVEGEASFLDYDFTIDQVGSVTSIWEETLSEGPGDAVFRRSASETVALIAGHKETVPQPPSDTLLLGFVHRIKTPHPRPIDRVRRALAGIQAFVPFDVQASWVSRLMGRNTPVREPALLQPADRLEVSGRNLANVFLALKNRPIDEWLETLEVVRLGLGPDVLDVSLNPHPGGGSISLSLKFANREVPAWTLSDGELAYLAHVALYRMSTGRSLVAIDEPESHLHPALLARVLDFLEDMSKETSVLVTTQSDRLLDGLSEPAREAVLCELGENRTTRILRPDPRALQQWLEEYRGLGEIRASGHEGSVMSQPEERS